MPAPKTAIRSTVVRLLRNAPGAQGDRRPVVLLHGFASSPRVLVPLQRHLERDLEREVLPIAISPGLRDLRDSAGRVNERIATLVESRGVGAADIVGWDVPFISIISEIGVACALRARREQWRPFA